MKKSGQTLVEIIVAVGVMVIIAMGLVASVTTSLNASQFGRTKSISVRLTQEALEQARILRDSGWDSFFAYGNPGPQTWCLNAGNVWSSGSCANNIDSKFSRSVDFHWSNSHMIVTATVSWQEGSKINQTVVTTYLTQWK